MHKLKPKTFSQPGRSHNAASLETGNEKAVSRLVGSFNAHPHEPISQCSQASSLTYFPQRREIRKFSLELFPQQRVYCSCSRRSFLAAITQRPPGCWFRNAGSQRAASRHYHPAPSQSVMGQTAETSDGAFNHILQFTNVARPVVRGEKLHGVFGQPHVGAVQSATAEIVKMSGQRSDVPGGVRAGRHMDRERAESVVEILAETIRLLLTRLRSRFVSRDDARIHMATS